MTRARKAGRKGSGKVKGRRLPKSLTPEQLEGLLEATKGRTPTRLRNRAMLLLMAEGGLRVSEVTGLRLGNLTTEKDEPIALRVIGKGDKERTVYLRQRSRDALAAWLERRRGNNYPGRFVFCTLTRGVKYPPQTRVWKEQRQDDRRRKVARSKFIAGTQHPVKVEPGRPIQNRYLNGLLSRLAEKAGLPHITPHQLRHTAAQRLYDSTGDLGQVKQFLGHESIDTTDIYAQASPLQVKAALEAMDEPEPEPSPLEKLMAGLTERQRLLLTEALREADGGEAKV